MLRLIDVDSTNNDPTCSPRLRTLGKVSLRPHSQLCLHDHRLAQPVHNSLDLFLDPAQQILTGGDVVDEPDGGTGGPDLCE